MDLIDKLLVYFEKQPVENSNNAPEGLCTLCWGRQEYDGKIRVMIKDPERDIINHKKKDLLLKDFIRQHIDGIVLTSGEIKSCPTCGCDNEKVTKIDSE